MCPSGSDAAYDGIGNLLTSGELDRILLQEQLAGHCLKSQCGRPDHPDIHRALVQAIVDHDADSSAYRMKKHSQHGYEEAQADLAAGAKTLHVVRRTSPRRKAT